ncbi:hypothetical protein STEG23_014473 [Scotinomys teguina]
MDESGDPVDLVNDADTPSSHLVINCPGTRTRETETGDVESRGQELESGVGHTYVSSWSPAVEKQLATCIPASGSPVAQRKSRADGNHTEEEIPTPQWSLGAVQVRAKQNLGPEVVMWEEAHDNVGGS